MLIEYAKCRKALGCKANFNILSIQHFCPPNWENFSEILLNIQILKTLPNNKFKLSFQMTTYCVVVT